MDELKQCGAGPILSYLLRISLSLAYYFLNLWLKTYISALVFIRHALDWNSMHYQKSLWAFPPSFIFFCPILCLHLIFNVDTSCYTPKNQSKTKNGFCFLICNLKNYIFRHAKCFEHSFFKLQHFFNVK